MPSAVAGRVSWAWRCVEREVKAGGGDGWRNRYFRTGSTSCTLHLCIPVGRGDNDMGTTAAIYTRIHMHIQYVVHNLSHTRAKMQQVQIGLRKRL